MKHYDLKTVLQRANDSINESFPDKSREDKLNMVFGWLQNAYDNIYKDLAEDKKAPIELPF